MLDRLPHGEAVLNLRDWLDRLAMTDRLSIIRPGIDLVHQLAAVGGRIAPPTRVGILKDGEL